MINWEEIIKAESNEELKEAKLWLFRENVRLQNEKKELEASKNKFINERVRLRNELNDLNQKVSSERRRLKEESMFFDKKMDILRAGFVQLDSERKKFEEEKQSYLNASIANNTNYSMEDFTSILFTNVKDRLTLRKRYRDLVKIFHPDNPCGDAEIMLAINKEYLKRKEEL